MIGVDMPVSEAVQTMRESHGTSRGTGDGERMRKVVTGSDEIARHPEKAQIEHALPFHALLTVLTRLCNRLLIVGLCCIEGADERICLSTGAIQLGWHWRMQM